MNQSDKHRHEPHYDTVSGGDIVRIGPLHMRCGQAGGRQAMSAAVARAVVVFFAVAVHTFFPRPSAGLEIPLRYCEQADIHDSAPLHISRIRVADFDMLQETVREPPTPTLRAGLQPSQPNVSYSGYASVPLNALQPPGKWSLPRDMAPPALFGLLPLGDRQHLVAMDSPCSTRPDVRLWCDADGDSSLVDDPVYSVPGSVDSRLPCVHPEVSWPGIRADVLIGDCHSPYVLRVTARCAATSGSIVSGNLNIRPACWYTGEAEIGTNRYRFILCDSNANGRFDDRPIASESRDHSRTTVHFAGGDKLLLSGAHEPGADDSILFRGPIQLGGDWYSPAFETCKGLARLEPVANGPSMVTLSCPVNRIEWASPDYSRTLAAIDPGTHVRLPDGDWRPYSYRMDRTAPDGTTWRLSARWAETSAPVVAAGQSTASLQLGGPYRMAVKTVQEDRVPGSRRAISVSDAATVPGAPHAAAQQSLLVVADLVGASGEHVTGFRCMTRAHRPPSYRLVDSRGQAVSMGMLEPAWECVWMTRLRPSQNEGPHTLHVQWDLGPFGVAESATTIQAQ